MVRRITASVAFWIVLFSTSLALQDPPPARLNVLFIVADDLNTNLGCYGHPVVKSPNIDRLASRGVLFRHAYCQYPLCNPSRTSFLSGRRPETTRVFDNDTYPRTHLKDVVFLPQHFRRHGYFTARADKIFHIFQPGGLSMDDPANWDVTVEMAGKYYPELTRLEKHIVRRGSNWAVLDAPDDVTGDGMVARSIARMMEEASREGRPFFLGAGFRKPHAAYVAPKQYFDLYAPERIPLPDEPPEHLRSIPRAALTYEPGKRPRPEEERRQIMAAYYAAISFMDAQVGVLLDALDRLELWDKTVVVLLGDHGYHLGEHGGMWNKRSLFEESASTPLIIAAPSAKAAGHVSPRTVELLDLYPTLVELCELPDPGGLEGKSLVPLLNAANAPWDKPAHTIVSREGFFGESVRTERFRFTEWAGGREGTELYDHQSDPREYRNLANEPRHAETVAEMKRLLREHTAGAR